MSENILELKNITKQFPGVLANDQVNLSIEKGEIHAIIGENGAGKSTLMNIIYGLHKPSSGSIYYKGSEVKLESPLDSIGLGIGMVHQHFMLVPSFTVAENIVLGNEPKRRAFIDSKKSIEISNELSRTYGLQVPAESRVETLSVGVQQRVEILKALHKGADLLILDEPTAILTPQETEDLFKVIKKLVDELGKTIIIITHKLQEVLSISDRISVMRQGRMIGSIDTKDANEHILAEMMVGREVLFDKLEKVSLENETILKTVNIEALDNRGLKALNGINLDLRSGEILGVAGIEGNGQSELLEVITGLRPATGGDVLIKGVSVVNKKPNEIREMGLSHVPEDRLVTGMSKEASIWENILMGSQRSARYRKRLVLDKKKILEDTDGLIEQYDIRTPSAQVLGGNLSGGNMQKVVIAREFSFPSEILIISQPTRGVDIGAIEFIHKEIVRKRNQGAAILLVSAELDELFRLADRIVTIYEGKLTGEFKPEDISKTEIGLYMTGKVMSQEGR